MLGPGAKARVRLARGGPGSRRVSRGVAVVSDDPRFDLQPLGIDGPTGPVSIRLYAAWHPDHHGAATIGRLAARLAAFCVARYGEQGDATATPGTAALPGFLSGQEAWLLITCLIRV